MCIRDSCWARKDVSFVYVINTCEELFKKYQSQAEVVALREHDEATSDTFVDTPTMTRLCSNIILCTVSQINHVNQLDITT